MGILRFTSSRKSFKLSGSENQKCNLQLAQNSSKTFSIFKFCKTFGRALFRQTAKLIFLVSCRRATTRLATKHSHFTKERKKEKTVRWAGELLLGRQCTNNYVFWTKIQIIKAKKWIRAEKICSTLSVENATKIVWANWNLLKGLYWRVAFCPNVKKM